MTLKKTKRARAEAATAPIESDPNPVILINADAILAVIPVPMTYDQLMQFERRGRMPRALRLISQKSAPLWAVEPVVEWINAHFGTEFPRQCREAERRLRAHKGCEIVAHHRSKPRVKIFSVADGTAREETVPNARDLVRTGQYRW